MSRGTYATITKEDRLRLISAFEDGRDWLQVLNIKRQTAQSIIAKFRKTGERESAPRGGAHGVKVDDEMTAALVRFVEEKPTCTLETCAPDCNKNFPINQVSVSKQ